MSGEMLGEGKWGGAQSKAFANFYSINSALPNLNLRLPMWKTLNPELEEMCVSWKRKALPFPVGLGLSCLGYEKLC